MRFKLKTLPDAETIKWIEDNGGQMRIGGLEMKVTTYSTFLSFKIGKKVDVQRVPMCHEVTLSDEAAILFRLKYTGDLEKVA